MSDQKLGQVLEKACVRFRGYIFSPIIMKLILGLFGKWVIAVQKLGHQVKCLEATFSV